jgi:acyl carrier protein
MDQAKSVEQALKEMIVERLFLSVEPSAIGDEDPLMEKYEVDSVRLLEIVVGLEEVFDISLEDDEFSIERFESVKAIADLVREKRGEKG